MAGRKGRISREIEIRIAAEELNLAVASSTTLDSDDTDDADDEDDENEDEEELVVEEAEEEDDDDEDDDDVLDILNGRWSLLNPLAAAVACLSRFQQCFLCVQYPLPVAAGAVSFWSSIRWSNVVKDEGDSDKYLHDGYTHPQMIEDILLLLCKARH